MQHTLIAAYMLICSIPLLGQSDLEIVKIKNEDRSVSISIVNYSTTAYDITVSMKLEGMRVLEDVPTNIYIPSDTTIHYCTLIPTASQTKYSIRYQAAPVDDDLATFAYDSPNIILYSKNGDTKSTEARIYLEKHQIPYMEYNVSYNKAARKRYDAMLVRRALNPKKVKLPVLVIRGEVHSNIKDMSSFLDRMF